MRIFSAISIIPRYIYMSYQNRMLSYFDCFMYLGFGIGNMREWFNRSPKPLNWNSTSIFLACAIARLNQYHQSFLERCWLTYTRSWHLEHFHSLRTLYNSLRRLWQSEQTKNGMHPLLKLLSMYSMLKVAPKRNKSVPCNAPISIASSTFSLGYYMMVRSFIFTHSVRSPKSLEKIRMPSIRYIVILLL